METDKQTPLGIKLDKVYTMKANKSIKVTVQGIVMHFGIPYVGLSNGVILKAEIFIRKFREK